MRKRLPKRFALPGAVSKKFYAPASPDRNFIRRAGREPLMQRFIFLLISLLALSAFTTLTASAQDFAATSHVKRLAPFQSSDTEEGSRVRITSDSSLDDYRVFESAGRFHILIPQADSSAANNGLRGRGFADVKVEREGSNLDISFLLRAGATASVVQRFNRLDVNFTFPVDAAAKMVKVTADRVASVQTAAGELSGRERSSALVENASLAAQPVPTPEPKSTSTKSAGDSKSNGSKSSTSSAGGKAGGLVLPAEKANPIRIPR
nr:hypothetical protein [Acidobacteriota bacterium]